MDRLDTIKKGTADDLAAQLRGLIDNYVSDRAEAAAAVQAKAGTVAQLERKYSAGLAKAAPDLDTLAADLAQAREAHRAAQERAAAFAKAPANPSDALMGMDGPHRALAQALERAACLELAGCLEKVGALCAELEATLARARWLPELVDTARGVLPVSLRTSYEPAASVRTLLNINTDALAKSLRPKKPRGPVALHRNPKEV